MGSGSSSCTQMDMNTFLGDPIRKVLHSILIEVLHIMARKTQVLGNGLETGNGKCLYWENDFWSSHGKEQILGRIIGRQVYGHIGL